MTVVDLYTLQLIQDEAPEMQWIHKSKTAAIMAEAEQNITDLSSETLARFVRDEVKG